MSPLFMDIQAFLGKMEQSMYPKRHVDLGGEMHLPDPRRVLEP